MVRVCINETGTGNEARVNTSVAGLITDNSSISIG